MKGLPCGSLVSEPDARPRHVVAAHTDWPWLPTQRHGHLARHPYCAHCGMVAHVGGERAAPMGGLVNRFAALARLLEREGIHVTTVQRRLVIKRLEAHGADDTFAISADLQDRLFSEAVAAYFPIKPARVLALERG